MESVVRMAIRTRARPHRSRPHHRRGLLGHHQVAATNPITTPASSADPDSSMGSLLPMLARVTMPTPSRDSFSLDELIARGGALDACSACAPLPSLHASITPRWSTRLPVGRIMQARLSRAPSTTIGYEGSLLGAVSHALLEYAVSAVRPGWVQPYV